MNYKKDGPYPFMRLFAIGDLHRAIRQKADGSLPGPAENHWQRIAEDWKTESPMTIPSSLATSWAMRLDEAQEDLDQIRALPGKSSSSAASRLLWPVLKTGTAWMPKNNMRTILVQRPFSTTARSAALTAGSARAIHYQEERSAVPPRTAARRTNAAGGGKLGGGPTILMLHYPPVCDLTKPSGFTELLEKYKVTCNLRPSPRHAAWDDVPAAITDPAPPRFGRLSGLQAP